MALIVQREIRGPKDDHRDIDAMFKQHGPRCMRIAEQVTKDHHHAQDAVQDAFMAFCRDAERVDAQRGDIGCWLAMLTRRRAVDLVRREQARPRPAPTPDAVVSHPAVAVDPELEAAATIRSEQVRNFLLTLDPVKRQIIFMAYYLGYTQAQIAAATGMPLGTVKTRQRIALRELRSIMTAA